MGDSGQFIILVFIVEVGDPNRFIIFVLHYRWAIPTDLFPWFYSRDGRQRSFYYLGFTVEVGDIDRFTMLVFQ